MTTFTKTFNATVTFSAQLSSFRWYSGSFKEVSVANLRAVARAIRNFITVDPRLI